MAGPYLNVITFLLTTLFYYMSIKPNLTYDMLTNDQQYKSYINNKYVFLAIYFLLVIMIQFMVNTSIITTMCGGNISENLGVAGSYTIFPWLLIFGILLIVLTILPGFKSAFSDVVGYYYVANSANNLLTELLIDKDIQQKIEGDSTLTGENKTAMESAADAILKIVGNSSILINQMVPENFERYWTILKPLMKPGNFENTDSKRRLFDLVVTRDNIGEAMWYIYTGLLLTSIVHLKIVSRGCSNSPKVMEQKYQNFLDQEKQISANKQTNTNTVYTL